MENRVCYFIKTCSCLIDEVERSGGQGERNFENIWIKVALPDERAGSSVTLLVGMTTRDTQGPAI